MSRKLEWIVARTAFPLAITASVGGAIVLINRGESPESVTGLIIFLSYLSIATFERA